MALDLELLPDKPKAIPQAGAGTVSKLDLSALPDKPGQVKLRQPGKLAGAIKQGLRYSGLADVPAQIQDIASIPSRLAGFKTIPLQSKLATETLPYLAEKATTPIGKFPVPQLGTRYTKSGIPLPKITLGEVSPTPLDIALFGLISKSGVSDIAGRTKWNIQLEKGIQSEKLRGVIMENIAPLEQALAKGGIRLPSDLPLEDKVNIIISVGKNATFGTLLKGLEKGQIKPLPPLPKNPIDIEPLVKPTPVAKTSPIVQSQPTQPVSAPTAFPIAPMPQAIAPTIAKPAIPEIKLGIAKLPGKPIQPPKPKVPKVKTLIGAVIKAGGIDPQILAKDYNLKEWKEFGLMAVLRKGGRQLDDLYDELVGQNLILPAPETINPSDWVVQQLREGKGKFLEGTEEFEKQLEQEYNQFLADEKAKGVTNEDVAREQREIEAVITQEIIGKTDEAVIGESEWEQIANEFKKRISKSTTIEELMDISDELGQEITEINQTDISRLYGEVDKRQQAIIAQTPQQAIIPGTEPKMPELKLRAPIKTELFQEMEGLFKPSVSGTGFAKAKEVPELTPEAQPHKIEMPEVVKLASDLLGKYPIVKRLAGKYGYFSSKGSGKITLDPAIFKNPNFAGAVLSHEIGHLTDWLPDYTLKRGNLLGRLLTLHKYLKNTFGTLDITNKEVKAELKALTQWWNPFTEVKNSTYTKYRYSSKELYADAISVLLNEPDKLQELAPQFYKTFWANIDKKPEVQTELLELQDFLAMGEGEKLKVRQQDIRGAFKTGEEKFFESRTKHLAGKKNLWFRLRTELIDKNTAILDKIKQAQKEGKLINPEDNPQYYLEDWNYIGGKVKNLIEEISKETISKANISEGDLGEYLLLRRIITERADIANPLGHNRETAQKQLDYLKETLGPQKFADVESAALRFQQIIKRVITKAMEAGLYKEDTFAQMITNPAYATFQVLDYIDDYIAPSVIHQIGTLKPIANPFVSTVMKLISTLRATERNITNAKLVDFMRVNFPEEIETAKVRRFGKFKAEIPGREGFGIIKTRENGQLKGYYVDPYIAQSVNYQPSGATNGVLSVLRFFNKSYFRPVYVNLNLSFQSVNLIRDFMRAWKLNPGVSFPQMLNYYWKALPIAKQRIWGDFSPPVITQMQESGMLSHTYNDIMREERIDDETHYQYLLQQYDILKKTPNNPVVKFFNYIEELGDFIENLPKITGYLSRVKSGRNIKEIAHEVRVYAGSPDFLRKGTGYDWENNVFLFSNAIKEGFRGDFEGAFTNPKTRSGYWWKTARANFIPKLLMFLAGLGYFGKKIKENYDKQTEYDKTNYITLPMGLTENGKAVYFRIPQDETGRLLGGIFWKTLNFDKEKVLDSLKDIGSYAGGQIPSLSPVLELTSSWTQYTLGKNPYDWFRGREVLTDDERQAGGWYSLDPMLRWTAGKMGVYAFTIKAKREEESTFEKVINFTPIAQRFIRITDYGETERERKSLQERKQQRSILKLERRR